MDCPPPHTTPSGSKYVVGTQQGILSVFNRASGWGDCVDRIPGHPHSIDALCTLPSSYPSAHSTILTGSSDGLLRAVQLYPTKLLGAIADHGEFPIERVRVDMGGEGRWVGSVGHEEVIKLTDLKDVFEDDKEEDEGGDAGKESDEDSDDEKGDEALDASAQNESVTNALDDDSDDEFEKGSSEAGESSVPVEASKEDEADSDEELPKERKRKRKEKDPLNVTKRKKGRDQMEAESGFFSGL
jgi:WD repeat-containing protein 55